MSNRLQERWVVAAHEVSSWADNPKVPGSNTKWKIHDLENQYVSTALDQ